MHTEPPDQADPRHRRMNWAGLSAFTRQSLIATAQAFVAPTLAAGFLPPAQRSLAFVAAGTILATRQVQAGPDRFDPPLSSRDNLVVAGLGFSPFLLLLPLHAHYAQCDTALGRKVSEAWARATRTLRGSLGDLLRRYPVNFVFVRAAAQLGASALGSGLAYGYAATRDDRRLKPADQAPGAPPDRRTLASAAAIGAAMFSLPAALPLPAVWPKVCFGRRASPATTTAVVTAGLIAAALGTIAAVQPERRPTSHND